MLYIAEVVGRLAPLFGMGTVLLIFAGGFSFLAAAEPTNLNSRQIISVRKTAKRLLLFATFLAIVACLLPSKGTIYMIAASEAGEQVIKTPEAREMFEALRLRIMEELKVVTK